MGNTHWLEAALVDAPVVPLEKEDARLDTFFVHIGGLERAPIPLLVTKRMIERGGSARECWTFDLSAQGGSAFFLRPYWLDGSRAIICFGCKDGQGRSFVWKARFSEDDLLQEAEHLAAPAGCLALDRDSALRWWNSGAG